MSLLRRQSSAECRPKILRRLLMAEAQVGGPYLVHQTPSPQGSQREDGIRPGGEHKMKRLGRLPDESLEDFEDVRIVQAVNVVQHQDELVELIQAVRQLPAQQLDRR